MNDFTALIVFGAIMVCVYVLVSVVDWAFNKEDDSYDRDR